MRGTDELSRTVSRTGHRSSQSYWIRTALLVLSVILPTAYRGERGTLLVLSFLMLLLAISKDGRFRVHANVLSWAVACAAVGSAFMALGGITGAPGVPRIITVYVAWPLVYTLSLAAFRTRGALWWAAFGFLAAETVIALYGFAYVLASARIFPAWAAAQSLDLGQSITLSSGFVKVSYYSLNSLVFLVPFSIAGLLIWEFRSALFLVCTIAAAATGVVMAAISGRHALQLDTGLSPFIAMIFASFASGGVRKRALIRAVGVLFVGCIGILLAAAVLLALLNVKPDALANAFSHAFTTTKDVATNPRAAQFHVLISDWSDRPAFGAGLGATASGMVRSSEQPWAYELSYVALLFQVGVVGVLFYCIAVGWIYGNCINVIRKRPEMVGLAVPFLTGTTAFLIANATNPYLAAFDYLWTLFAPLAVVNCALLDVKLLRRGPNSLLSDEQPGVVG